MDSSEPARSRRDLLLIKALTCTMFFTFAMTTDAVGSIIPTLLVEFELSEAKEGTLLTVVESGFDKLPANRRDEAFRMNDGGWTGQLKNIAAYVTAA